MTNNSFTNIFIAVNRKIIKISFLLSFAFIFFGVQYSDFNLVSSSDNVILSWHTGLEENLIETVVERKSVNGVFISIATVAAKGDNSSYSYTDASAFKITDGIYKYKLKFVKRDGTYSYSKEQSVTHLTSVSKKTWGSIKALFR